jgi:hypothetical protein
MNYKMVKANIGDKLKINDNMSLIYERLADDLSPVWHEIPSVPGNKEVHEGNFVIVTDDVWFVYENFHWRMMTNSEHVEASRQVYMSGLNSEDRFSRPSPR